MRRTIGLAVFLVALAGGMTAGAELLLIPKQVGQPVADPPPLPVGDPKKPVVTLLGDDAHLLVPYLTNDEDYNGRGALAASEDLDVFAGASALRVGPLQRFRAEVPGWSFPIRETPKEGEFRYIRFAWKKLGGTSITLQMHTTEPASNWRLMNYYAGKKFFSWNLVQVDENLPTEWTVVTRDLFKDFGRRTVTGLAYTTTDGTAGLFDQIMLGRTVEDLDAASEEALGTVKPKKALDGKERDAAWAAFRDREREKAGPAVRQFLATAADQVGFIKERVADGLTEGQRREQAARIAKLVAELDAEAFDTRLSAEEALAELGEAATAALTTAAKAESAEVRIRANRLLKPLKTDGGVLLTDVRAARVVRVLERAATADAKALLKQMGDGDFGVEYQAPAKAAAGRVK